MSEQEYDLKKSEKVMGQLLPVIKDVHGRIVDGLHRKAANPDWEEEIREDIKTEEDYWKTRAHLNYSRRSPSEARQEKIQIINSLAAFYVKQGLLVSGEKEIISQGKNPNEVLDAVIKALDGAISATWIRQNIDRKYRQDQKSRILKGISDRDYSPVEKRIRGMYSSRDQIYADEHLKAYKEEVRAEALEDPEFVAKAASKIVEMPIETVIEATFETPEPLTHEQIEEIKDAYQETQEKVKTMRERPEVQERAKWFKMWSGMGNILSLLHVLYCPVCGKPASTHLVFKCHPENDMEKVNELVKEKLE